MLGYIQVLAVRLEPRCTLEPEHFQVRGLHAGMVAVWEARLGLASREPLVRCGGACFFQARPPPNLPLPASTPPSPPLAPAASQSLCEELKQRPTEVVQRYRELGLVDVAVSATSAEGTRSRSYRVRHPRCRPASQGVRHAIVCCMVTGRVCSELALPRPTFAPCFSRCRSR